MESLVSSAMHRTQVRQCVDDAVISHLTLRFMTGTLQPPSTSTGEKSMKTVDIALLSAA